MLGSNAETFCWLNEEAAPRLFRSDLARSIDSPSHCSASLGWPDCRRALPRLSSASKNRVALRAPSVGCPDKPPKICAAISAERQASTGCCRSICTWARDNRPMARARLQFWSLGVCLSSRSAMATDSRQVCSAFCNSPSARSNSPRSARVSARLSSSLISPGNSARSRLSSAIAWA